MPGTLTILEKWTQKEKLIKQISQQDRMLVTLAKCDIGGEILKE